MESLLHFFSTNCDVPSYAISFLLKHSSGVEDETIPIDFQPDCHYRGEMVYCEIPDPK